RAPYPPFVAHFYTTRGRSPWPPAGFPQRRGAVARETIVLVHGTWGVNSPWYQPGSKFCSDLEAGLVDLDCKAKVWSHAEVPTQVFRWTGDNAWSARSGAARQLAASLRRLAREGWTVHLVAHSHVGNFEGNDSGCHPSLPGQGRGGIPRIQPRVGYC